MSLKKFYIIFIVLLRTQINFSDPNDSVIDNIANTKEIFSVNEVGLQSPKTEKQPKEQVNKNQDEKNKKKNQIGAQGTKTTKQNDSSSTQSAANQQKNKQPDKSADKNQQQNHLLYAGA